MRFRCDVEGNGGEIDDYSAVYFMWVFILYSRNLLNHLQEWSYFIEMVAVC